MHTQEKLKRVFIPASQMVYGQVTGSSVLLTGGLGSGAPEFAELGTSGLGALKLANTTDEVDLLWKLPYDFDNKHRLLIRHWITSGYSSANGTITMTTLYSALGPNTALIKGATALNKTHGATTKVSATTLIPYWTPWGVIAPIATGANAGQTFAPSIELLALDFTASAVTGLTIGSDFVYLIGTELAYTSRRCPGEDGTGEGIKMADGQLGVRQGVSGDY